MSTVEFADFTQGEREALDIIVARAVALFQRVSVPRKPIDIRMDISATHAKCPLRLHELADADDGNFAHDIFGIDRHLSRETGELENFFLPRFSRPTETP